MSDDQLDLDFDRALRTTLRAQAPSQVPEALRSFVWMVPQRESAGARSRPFVLRFAAFATAAVAIAVTVGLVVLLAGKNPNGPVSGPTGPISRPSFTLRPASPAPSRTTTIEFTVNAGDQEPTAAELQTIGDVVFTRLAVYIPDASRDDVSVATDGSGAVSVTLDPTGFDGSSMSALISTLRGRGDVEFVAHGMLDALPGASIPLGVSALFSGTSVTSATLGYDDNGQRMLDVQLDGPATDKLANWSAGHVGSTLALTVDGEVTVAPVVQAPITEGEMIVILAGGNTLDDRYLEALLRSGPLPFHLDLQIPTFPQDTPRP